MFKTINLVFGNNNKEQYPELKNESSVFKYQDLIAFLCIAMVVALLLWKARYSFGEDDSGYLYVPQRLIQGDSLFIDDWHVSQLSALLLLIPMKIYLFFFNSTEGIILASRYFFIFCQTVISTFIYVCFRKHGLYSVFAAAIYLLHIPLTVTLALWYTSMTLQFMLLILLMILSVQNNNIKTKNFVIGFLFSLAVLCNPYLVFLYLFYSLFVLVNKFTRNIKAFPRLDHSQTEQCVKDFKNIFALKQWMWISAGAVFNASIFFAFLLSRASIKDLAKSIPVMLTFPEEFDLSNPSSIFSISRTIGSIFNLNPVLFVLCCIIGLSLLIDVKRIKHRSVYLVISVVVFLLYLLSVSFADQVYYYSNWMYPLAVMGLVCYVLTKKKNRGLLFGYIWGLICGLFMDISSTAGFWAGNIGLTISDVISVLIIGDLILEIQIQRKTTSGKNIAKVPNVLKKLSAPVLCVALLAQLGLMVYVDTDLKNTCFEYIYEDKSNELSVTLDRGPEKGCITTHLKSEQYYRTLNDLSVIKKCEKGPILITDNMIWCYLYLDFPYGTYTAWQFGAEFKWNISKLMYYYKINPERLPRYIYIPKPIYISSIDKFPYTEEIVQEIFDVFSEQFDFNVTEGDAGYILDDIRYK